jgi:hypothetical protein
MAITSPRQEIFLFKTPHFAAEVHRLVRRRVRAEGGAKRRLNNVAEYHTRRYNVGKRSEL